MGDLYSLSVLSEFRRLVGAVDHLILFLILSEGLPSNLLQEQLLLLVFLNDFSYTFLVVEAFHFAVPLSLFCILDLQKRLVLLPHVRILWLQPDCLLKTLLSPIEVIFTLVGKCHAVVRLGVVYFELKRIFTRLDAVLEAILLEEAQCRVCVKNIKDFVALFLLLVRERLFLLFGHVLEYGDAA